MTARSFQRSILIINPNTTKGMTDALKPLVDSLGYNTTRFEYFTAPSGVPSINNEDDAAVSAKACMPTLQDKMDNFDAFLVCCYSQHPLVPMLRAEIAIASSSKRKIVTGIFEASVATCLQSLSVDEYETEKFGIVSTGSQWQEVLDEAVANLLGPGPRTRYAGTETTGLNADELHTTPKEYVDGRINLATKILLSKGAKAICLGCAGMSGMDKTVREACIEHLGNDGNNVKIVDGVLSGIIFLEGTLRANL